MTEEIDSVNECHPSVVWNTRLFPHAVMVRRYFPIDNIANLHNKDKLHAAICINIIVKWPKVRKLGLLSLNRFEDRQ